MIWTAGNLWDVSRWKRILQVRWSKLHHFLHVKGVLNNVYVFSLFVSRYKNVILSNRSQWARFVQKFKDKQTTIRSNWYKIINVFHMYLSNHLPKSVSGNNISRRLSQFYQNAYTSSLKTFSNDVYENVI